MKRLFLLLPLILPWIKCLTFHEAQELKLMKGHEAAVDCFQKLLVDSNFNDMSAATRISAAKSTPERQDQVFYGDLLLDQYMHLHNQSLSSTPFQLNNNTSNNNKNLKSTHDQELQNLMKDAESLKKMLETSGYTNANVARIFGLPDNHPMSMHSKCPVFVRQAPFGSSLPPFKQEFDQKLQVLIALFMLGFSVSKELLFAMLKEEYILALQRLGLLFPCQLEEDVFVPYVQIVPLEISNSRTLHLITDCQPHVLNSINVGLDDDGAVMYIGPDSVSLFQHLPFKQFINHCDDIRYHILDLCCGSGIQALAVLATLDENANNQIIPTSKALCVDINKRALKFTKFNALLNGFVDRVEIFQANLQDIDSLSFLQKFNFASSPSSGFDIILANPPFIPVPSSETKRYGLFSSGGLDGEVVLRAILYLVSEVLDPKNGSFVGIVSEFMRPGDHLCRTIETWLRSNNFNNSIFHGVLFTNEFPLNKKEYAKRRGSSSESERQIWLDHLDAHEIETISPGLLFLQRYNSDNETGNKVVHVLVPKSDLGSIWTPHNRDAIVFTEQIWKEFVSEIR